MEFVQNAADPDPVNPYQSLWSVLADVFCKGDISNRELRVSTNYAKCPIRIMWELDQLMHAIIPRAYQLQSIAREKTVEPIRRAGSRDISAFADQFRLYLCDTLHSVWNGAQNLSPAMFWNTETALWLNFVAKQFPHQQVGFGFNFRALRWRLCTEVISGPASTWRAQYDTKLRPTLNPQLESTRGVIAKLDSDLCKKYKTSPVAGGSKKRRKSRQHRRPSGLPSTDPVELAGLQAVTKCYTQIWHDGNRIVHILPDVADQMFLKLLLAVHVRNNPIMGYSQCASYILAHVIRVLTVAAAAVKNGEDYCCDIVCHDLWSSTTDLIGCDAYYIFSRIMIEQQTLWLRVNPGVGTMELDPDLLQFKEEARRIMNLISLHDPDLATELANCRTPEFANALFFKWIDTLFAATDLPVDELNRIWDFLLEGFVVGAAFRERLRFFCAAYMIVHRGQFLQFGGMREPRTIDELMIRVADTTDRECYRRPVRKVIKLTYTMLELRPDGVRKIFDSWTANTLSKFL